MKRAILIVTVLFIAVISTACINNFAVQELNNKAKIYLENGDYDAAINRLQSSIDLDSTIFETHYNLGVAYIKNKQYKKAIESLSKALDLNPEYADSYYSLAVAQESYAQELLDANSETSTVTSEDNDDVEDVKVDEDIKKMSAEQRKLTAIELYTNAVASYKKYLLKSNDAKDSEDINNQIKSIEEELSKLGNE